MLILFDKTNRKSFDHIDSWVEEIMRYYLPNITLIIIGTKSDSKSQIST